MNTVDKHKLGLAARRIALADALARATDLDEGALDRLEDQLRTASVEAALHLGHYPPIELEEPAKRKPGRWKGVFSVGPEFFDPLPEEELKAWEGG